MSLKIIFTWWNKQTFGTFLKTVFFGKYVGSDEYGNKYYISKKMNVGLFTQKILKLLKLHQIGIYGFIIQLTKFHDKVKKHSWQKTPRKSNGN